MKITITSILASFAIALTAAASPSIRIEMTIATSDDRIVSRPSVSVQSGKPAIISSGDQESELTCALTPSLLDDGTVGIHMVFTQRKGKRRDTHASRIVVPFGKLAKSKLANSWSRQNQPSQNDRNA